MLPVLSGVANARNLDAFITNVVDDQMRAIGVRSDRWLESMPQSSGVRKLARKFYRSPESGSIIVRLFGTISLHPAEINRLEIE